MVKVFVEGGGDSNQLRTICRRGFSSFLEKAGLNGKMPRVVACGSRQHAFDDFCTALNNGENALLLVDAESSVDLTLKGEEKDYESWKPWIHFAGREGDKWAKPEFATNNDCHMMVQCMESWFLADRETLKNFFGQDFKEKELPVSSEIENIPKNQIYSSLSCATSKCKKGKYGKGDHSFSILEKIDPEKVMNASPWAKRFIDVLKQKMGVQ